MSRHICLAVRHCTDGPALHRPAAWCCAPHATLLLLLLLLAPVVRPPRLAPPQSHAGVGVARPRQRWCRRWLARAAPAAAPSSSPPGAARHSPPACVGRRKAHPGAASMRSASCLRAGECMCTAHACYARRSTDAHNGKLKCVRVLLCACGWFRQAGRRGRGRGCTCLLRTPPCPPPHTHTQLRRWCLTAPASVQTASRKSRPSGDPPRRKPRPWRPGAWWT